MTKIYVIGIGYRPLDKNASEAVYRSDVILASSRLLDVFKSYEEYESVKDKIRVLGDIHETMDFLRQHTIEGGTTKLITQNPELRTIALLAVGDPMFFGIGRMIIEAFDKDVVEIYPDLSSIQVAFSRIRETWNDAFLISVHGGPDPAKRRKLEYELRDIPSLLSNHDKIAILTDKVNNPAEIAKEIMKPSAVSRQLAALRMYVCEKLGYDDEKITDGTPEDISALSFVHPNVVIIKKEDSKQ
jgi:precorrin-6Y C5,15-methyltransferase (decarboxylating)